MNAAQLINQDSGDFEYYTPSEIVRAASRVMGGVDLDPASSPAANARIGAARFFTDQDNGLLQPWVGRVWMNHPFSRIGNRLWIEKLEQEFAAGRTAEACCICFAATSEQWFQPLARRPQCYLSPRTNFYLPDGTKKTGVTKGSVVTYYGQNIDAFYREFASMGVVKIPFAPHP